MKNLLFGLAVITLFLNGCKKQATSKTCEPVKIISATDTALLTCDAQHRITSVVDPSYTIAITYNGLTATSTNTTGGITKPFYTLYLNSKGNIQSMQYSSTFGGVLSDETTFLDYDDDTHLVRWRSNVYNHSTGDTRVTLDSMVYQNGNLVKKYEYLKMGNAYAFGLLDSIVYTYGSDENKNGMFAFYPSDLPGYGNMFYFFPLFGKASKNLVSHTVYTDNTGSQFGVDYGYLLNSDGYLQEENMNVSATPPFIKNVKFEYSCY